MKLKSILTVVLGAALSLAVPARAQAPVSKSGTITKKAADSAAAPTDKETADARAKGMVWVNTSTKVYHKDGQFYGKTKQGKFMTEDDAKKAGNRLAQEPATKKAKTDVKK
jgi:hypothetical protein